MDSLDAASADEPLFRLIQSLCDEYGRSKTAERLGVDRKTIYRALTSRKLTPRLRGALERERVTAEREAAGTDQLALRVEALERRLQDVEQQLAGGLQSMRDDQADLRKEVRSLGWSRLTTSGASTAGATTQAPHRVYTDVVTVEELPDEAKVVAEQVSELITQWREQRALFEVHWPEVDGLRAEVRMLELELVLIEEYRLTLPPAEVPWDWAQRRREQKRRRERLSTAGSALRRARSRRVWLGIASLLRRRLRRN